MNQLTKLIEQYERENPGHKATYTYNGIYHWRDGFVKWQADQIEQLASRPTCSKEQIKFLDEIEKLGYITLGCIDKLIKKLNLADDLAELTYNYATGKSNGDDIVKYVKDALDKI